MPLRKAFTCGHESAFSDDNYNLLKRYTDYGNAPESHHEPRDQFLEKVAAIARDA